MSYEKWDNYSNDDLIELIMQFKDKLGHVPVNMDYGKSNDMPSSSYLYKRLGCLNDIYKQLGYETKNNNGYTKEYGIDALVEFSKQIGRIPKRQDFLNYNQLPNYSWYLRNIDNSFKNVLHIAGLIEKPMTRDEKIQFTINNLIKYAKEINGIPKYEDFKKINKKLGGFGDILKVTGMTYNEICQKYLPKYSLNHPSYEDVTFEELKNNIVVLQNKLGKLPTTRDLVAGKSDYTYALYKRHFGNISYIKMLEKMGFEYSVETSIKKSDDRLIYDFKNFIKVFGRLPYKNEFGNNGLCGEATYRKRFGSLYDLCKRIGIDYDKFYMKSGAGKVCKDSKGHVCKSVAEKDISEYLYKLNANVKKEVRYDEIIENDKRRFDWKITTHKGNNYYIEYFGLYRDNCRGSIDYKYQIKAKKKIKDLYKADIIDNCIFIFPNDLKTKSLDEIFNKLIMEG